MEELLKGLAKALVENPDAVSVNRVEKDHSIVLELHVAESDMGRVIGKQGRIAKAIRTVMKAATAKESKRVSVEIM
ncbi:MAG: KH domain-containing protein [Clostridia bacterium]|nr:KH domain-containing protein [Clostridia bacterium]